MCREQHLVERSLVVKELYVAGGNGRKSMKYKTKVLEGKEILSQMALKLGDKIRD